jgi:hypothetical protein
VAAGRCADAALGAGVPAVQDDVAVTVVDWPVTHAWRVGDPDFVGAVTVLDDRGAPLVTVNWPAPTDRDADAALHEIGWSRVGPWQRDWEGRRSAPVTRTPFHTPSGLPGQHQPDSSDRAGSGGSEQS